MKTYTLSKALRYLTIPGALFFLTYGIIDPSAIVQDSYRYPIIIVVGVYIWYLILTTPHKIIFHDDNLIEFIALTKKVKLYPKDIESIEEHDTTPSITVHHKLGKTKISSLFDNLTSLKGTLKSLCSERTNNKTMGPSENVDKVDSTNIFYDQ